MSIDDDKLWKTDIITPITSKQNVNTGAQGDCFYLPLISMISNRTSSDTIDDKNKHFEYITDNCVRSNLIHNKQKQNPICLTASSSTFIVTSSPPLEINIQDNDYHTDHLIYSNASIGLSKTPTTFDGHQHQFWFKQHWISIIVTTGITVIFIAIITITTIIIH